jgi:cysteine-S-conjugate beta-lyase
MHQAHANAVIGWLQQQPAVARILYPALASDPGHAIWRRDFSGANGLLSVEFEPHASAADADRFTDSLRLFGIGACWGGFESLALTYPLIGWDGGTLVRPHIGLEDPADLSADLDHGFAAFGQCRA